MCSEDHGAPGRMANITDLTVGVLRPVAQSRERRGPGGRSWVRGSDTWRAHPDDKGAYPRPLGAVSLRRKTLCNHSLAASRDGAQQAGQDAVAERGRQCRVCTGPYHACSEHSGSVGWQVTSRRGVASLQQACLAQSHGGDLLGDFIVLARGCQTTGYKARAGAIFFVKMAHAALEA